MSWSTFHTQVASLMTAEDFVESETTFDLDNLPASVSDKAFSLTVASFGGESQQGRVLIPTVKLSVIFDIGDSSTTLYNSAIASVEWIIANITRQNMTGNIDIDFTGAQARMVNPENFLIFEFTFNAYYQ